MTPDERHNVPNPKINRLFAQHRVQENTTNPHHWPFMGGIYRFYIPCGTIFLYKILRTLYKWWFGNRFHIIRPSAHGKQNSIAFVTVMNLRTMETFLDISAPYDLHLTHGRQSLTPRYGAETAGYEAPIQVNWTAGHFRTIIVAKYWQEIARRIRGRRGLIDQWLGSFLPNTTSDWSSSAYFE